MAGHLPMMFEMGYAAVPSIKGGKIRALQETTAGSSVVERAARMLSDLRDEIRDPRPTVLPSGAGPARTSEREPIPVRIQPAPPGPLEIIQSIIGPLIDPLATTGLVIIFAIFILLQREDLRDAGLAAGDVIVALTVRPPEGESPPSVTEMPGAASVIP